MEGIIEDSLENRLSCFSSFNTVQRVIFSPHFFTIHLALEKYLKYASNYLAKTRHYFRTRMTTTKNNKLCFEVIHFKLHIQYKYFSDIIILIL